MDQLQEFFSAINQFRISYPDRWAALTLFLGVFALIVALIAVRRSGRSGSSQVGRVDSKVQSLELKFDSERVKHEQGTHSLLQRIAELEARIEELEIGISPDQDIRSKPAVPLEPAAVQPAKRKGAEKRGDAERYVPTALTLGLKKTRSGFFGRLRGLFDGKSSGLVAILPGLEELLLSSDLGVRTTDRLVKNVRERFSGSAAGSVGENEVIAVLKDSIEQILSSSKAPQIEPVRTKDGPLVIIVVGVNGVGKTTTIGKLAAQFRAKGATVLLGACDTFRAAAVEQLKNWAERTGCEVVSGDENAKPATVAFQAVTRAKQGDVDVLILDTAGRLHTRSNLMNELEGVVRIVGREYPGAPHEIILVLDASTGQNALLQAREFNQRGELSGVVVTKLDGTPKGGIIVAIKEELGVPIRYIGVGEGIDDLRIFSAKEFAEGLFEGEEEEGDGDGTEVVSARAAVRRKRKEVGE